MDILIIDQCSNAKSYPSGATVYDAEALDNRPTAELTAESSSQKARQLYDGRQQQYISQAVDSLRANTNDEVDRYFISAGLGLINEQDEIPPYDVTFNDYSEAEISERTAKLDIEQDILNVLENQYDLVVFALGSDYYQTFELSTVLDIIAADTWVVCFNCEPEAEGYENVISLPARTEQAKEQGTIVVALKGKYLQNFAEHRSHGREITGPEDIRKYCLTEYTTQSGLGEYEK